MKFEDRKIGVTRCEACGKELTRQQRHNRQVYCSRECFLKVKGMEPVREHICKYCGKRFKPKDNNGITYCSRECAYADKAHKCKTCGKAIPGTKSKYCSDGCKPKRICVICGKEFIGIKTSAYCSSECRKHSDCRKARARAESKHISEIKPTVCKNCGNEFMPQYGNKLRKFCSNKCGIAYARKQYRKKHPEKKSEERHRRRARLHGSKMTPIDISAIYQRDNWVCQICGKRVNPNNKYPHPLSPSLDHIIPLSIGGTHEPRNVQLAHFRCNSLKSDNANNEQLRLFG